MSAEQSAYIAEHFHCWQTPVLGEQISLTGFSDHLQSQSCPPQTRDSAEDFHLSNPKPHWSRILYFLPHFLHHLAYKHPNSHHYAKILIGLWLKFDQIWVVSQSSSTGNIK